MVLVVQDLSEPILLTLLHLITDPSTRAYLKPFLDLQVRTPLDPC